MTCSRMPEIGTESWLDGISLLYVPYFKSVNKYKLFSKSTNMCRPQFTVTELPH